MRATTYDDEMDLIRGSLTMSMLTAAAQVLAGPHNAGSAALGKFRPHRRDGLDVVA